MTIYLSVIEQNRFVLDIHMCRDTQNLRSGKNIPISVSNYEVSNLRGSPRWVHHHERRREMQGVHRSAQTMLARRGLRCEVRRLQPKLGCWGPPPNLPALLLKRDVACSLKAWNLELQTWNIFVYHETHAKKNGWICKVSQELVLWGQEVTWTVNLFWWE